MSVLGRLDLVTLDLDLQSPTHTSSRGAAIGFSRTVTATNMASEYIRPGSAEDPASFGPNHTRWAQTTPMALDRVCVPASSSRQITALIST
jgi:hypothetical protein